MKLIAKLVCKSTPENFRDEKSDVKNNTMRDWSVELQEAFDSAGLEVIIDKIIVVNSDSGESFERVVRHQCVFDGKIICTWEPKGYNEFHEDYVVPGIGIIGGKN